MCVCVCLCATSHFLLEKACFLHNAKPMPNPTDAKPNQCQTHPTSCTPNANPTFVPQLVECTTHDTISEGPGFNSSQFLYHICGIHTQFICVLKCCKGIGLGLQKLSMHATYVSKELAGIELRTLERLHN